MLMEDVLTDPFKTIRPDSFSDHPDCETLLEPAELFATTDNNANEMEDDRYIERERDVLVGVIWGEGADGGQDGGGQL